MPDVKLETQVKAWKQSGQMVVLVTGVFDLLHIEHLRFLNQAKAAGDKLVVGIETDARVKQIKGPYRPIHPQVIRLEQVRALAAVDAAFLLPENFNSQAQWEGLIEALRPDIYAVSSHTGHLENKRRVMAKFGGKLQIVYQHNPAYSTSLLIAQMINPHIAENHPVFKTEVIPGFGQGKTIGFPTLNLKIPRDFPYQHGIYAGWVWISSTRKFLGAFHYGPIPVFGHPEPSLEVYLIKLDHDISVKSIRFQLRHYLRPIKNFASQTELTTQITQDVRLVETLLSR